MSSDEWKKTGVGSQVLIGMRDISITYLVSRISDHLFLLGFMFRISMFEFPQSTIPISPIGPKSNIQAFHYSLEKR